MHENVGKPALRHYTGQELGSPLRDSKGQELENRTKGSIEEVRNQKTSIRKVINKETCFKALKRSGINYQCIQNVEDCETGIDSLKRPGIRKLTYAIRKG